MMDPKTTLKLPKNYPKTLKCSQSLKIQQESSYISGFLLHDVAIQLNTSDSARVKSCFCSSFSTGLLGGCCRGVLALLNEKTVASMSSIIVAILP